MAWLRPKHVVLYSYVNIKIHTYSNVFTVNVLFLFLFEKRLQRLYENEGELTEPDWTKLNWTKLHLTLWQ
jgi:hypothetical protein